MALEPKVGMVIRYDFLWKDEQERGRLEGSKDRPCAIITMTKENPDGSRNVAVAPITHSQINAEKGETGVKIPVQMARHLKLDDDQSYIKTHEFNTFRWDKGRIPFGVTRARGDSFVFGQLHNNLTRAAYDQTIENRSRGQLKGVNRDQLDQEDVKKNDDITRQQRRPQQQRVQPSRPDRGGRGRGR